MLRKTDDPRPIELPHTMDRHQLAAHIREFGIWDIVDVFTNPGAQVVMGLRDGINIAGWSARGSANGYILFVRDRPEEGVIYVNTDNRTIIANHVAALPFPAIGIGRTEAKRDDVNPVREARHRAAVAHLLPDAHR